MLSAECFHRTPIPSPGGKVARRAGRGMRAVTWRAVNVRAFSLLPSPTCHCEERSDVAIRSPYRTLEKRIPTAFGLGMTVIFGGWVEACVVSCFGRLSPAFLFRHGLRRATFPPGEGIGGAGIWE